ncbi:hypothetical protein ACF0H5_018505 [Mactra antiquata]
MKLTIWVCLLMVSMTAKVYGFHSDYENLDYNDEYGYNDNIDQQEHDIIQNALQDVASGGVDAIARYLGFLCPKGHRCLPVLECLPCDYGTFKSNAGSDLCEQCPPGCTTLRKGAVSWKECVPKCPPGYEESECGKTCSKCRPGYYKSTWKNKLCSKCPRRANVDRNMVGMTKRRECFADEDTMPEPIEETTAAPVIETQAPVPEGCDVLGACDAVQYAITRLVAAPINECRQFCQCTHDEGYTLENPKYKWVLHDCPSLTLFDSAIRICNHEDLVQCHTSTEASTMPTNPTSSSQGNSCYDVETCDVTTYQPENLMTAPYTNCTQFCQCAYDTNSAGESWNYHWVQQDCPLGTKFNVNTQGCDHADSFECPEYA